MSQPARAAFAIPGDITTVTGGFIYERRLLEGLRASGRRVDHLHLAASFPDPDPAEMVDAVAQMVAVAPDAPLIIDGLVFGSVETAGLATVRAPILAMIHHPLALECGLSADRRAHLFRTERDNLQLVRHVLVPSPHTRSILIGEYGVPPDRITVARPGVERHEGPRDPADPPLVLSVGIQHPRKGHDVLIAALGEIRDLPWRAVIAGGAYDPAHAAALTAQIARLELGGRIALAGFVPDPALHGHYRAASVFALATRYEGHGLVFDEALSYGLPIVSCRTGAVPDTVPTDAGLLVAPGDPAAFARALRRVLGDTALRDGLAEAATRAGQRLPTWDRMVDTAGSVLDRIAAGE